MKKIVYLFVLFLFIGSSASAHPAKRGDLTPDMARTKRTKDQTTQPVQRSNLTPGMAKTKIIKGLTAQNEILEVFGAPNIVTKNKSGNEVWTYDKASVETGASDVYGTILIAGAAKSKTSTSTRTFTLMIEFDENDVVKDFSYRSSEF